MTIRRKKGRIEGLTVGLLGDISPLTGCAVEHLGADQAGRQGDSVRAADTGAQGLGAYGLRGLYHLDEVLPRCDVSMCCAFSSSGSRGGCFLQSVSIRSFT